MKKTEKIIYEDDSVFSFPVNHSDFPGASGSPTLNDQGQVVGVLSIGYINLVSAVIKINPLKNFTVGDTGQNCEAISFKNCFKKEIENLRNLAKQNYTMAQFRLGFTYFYGQGVTKNYELAFYWMKKAAEQGDASAQRNLGFMFLNGQGVPQSYEQAFLWWQQAARQGDPIAQNNLGLMYLLKGYGVIQNDKLAFDWIKKAAEQGYALAQTNLALMYKNGEGVPQNNELAKYWLQKAAEQGFALN